MSRTYHIPSTDEKGFTLIEVLIALVVSSLAAGAIYSTYIFQVKTNISQRQISEIQQNLRASMYLIENGIRQACLDPLGSAHPEILIADKHEFRYQADLNGNGKEFNTEETDEDSAKSGSDPDEEVWYHLSNDKDQNGIADNFPCRLGRADWNGVLEPMADNIEALNFVYLDPQGNRLGPLPLDHEHRALIKIIEITLIARSTSPDSTYSDMKTYFNLQGDIILNAPKDQYHRRILSKAICLRNH